MQRRRSRTPSPWSRAGNMSTEVENVAVLKKLTNTLKGKDVVDLTVYLPEDTNKTTPCNGSTDLVEVKEGKPYWVTVNK
jgi:hypothetical protein